jgi:DnaJ-class molecular chaperone
VHEAYSVLVDAERRAAYDVKYDEAQGTQWKILIRKRR